MCGIAGIFHFDPSRKAERGVLKRMTDCLYHRGPDGEGFHISGNAALGHRRLSIIDLATGDQPMFNEDKSISVILNGEIYNYIELREELKGYGCSFRTTSDTEVIIRAYEKWGIDCQNRLNGMWAFALLDERKKQLFISRDRIGEKPLFYAIHDHSVIFGSEIKSILAYGVPQIPRFELTELYLTLGYVPAPYTFYKDIHKLPAGHCLVISGDSAREKKYWDLPAVDENNMNADRKQVYAQFERLLEDSVRIRMRSDVPFGAFLSGGLDSAAVVSLMSGLSSTPVKTFTIGFKEKAFDERRLAQLVAEKYKTDHHEYMIERDAFDAAITRVMHHFDEPFGDSSALPTGYVSKIAAQKVKMVLTGDGGDEVLSGYNANQLEKFSNFYHRIPGFIRAGLPGTVERLASLAGGDRSYKLRRVAKGLRLSDQPYNYRLVAKLCRPELAGELVIDHAKQIKVMDFISDFTAKYPAKNSFYRLMYFQFKLLLPDDFLTKVDRMSMAHSLETRIPFLDYRLVEFMMQVSQDVKMEGYQRKSVLINSLGRRLPPDLIHAPKRGFSIPLREWFKDKSFEQRLETLSSGDFGISSDPVKRLVRQNQTGEADWGNLLWMLFVLKKWLSS